MDREYGNRTVEALGNLSRFMREWVFKILSAGPIPQHIAFILDGNRRYAKQMHLEEADGYRAGFLALMSILKYCYELGVSYVTIYAFSIDNFKRKPETVQRVMDLMMEKIQGLLEADSIMHQYGIKVHFLGNLKLLSQPLREAAEEVMKVSANNSNIQLLICMSYTSTDEIVHATRQSCKKSKAAAPAPAQMETKTGISSSSESHAITLVDIEREMYMSVAPEVDILIRTSGETRLSNFLLWQTNNCLLYSPTVLWPKIGLWHLIWAVLNFQRVRQILTNNNKIKQL